MKKFFSFLLVLLALFTVSACIGEAPVDDDDDDVVVIDEEATYYTYLGSVDNLNPYSETLANSSELYGFITDSLYSGDYDWATAIELGLAEEEGDFTNTADLPFNYFPSMAADYPEDVNGDGLTWRISLRQDLVFEDGTVIDAHTFDYSWSQLLDPTLLNARATELYAQDSLPLVNGQAYFSQLTPDLDGLGYEKYDVDGVVYTRENSYYGTVIDQPTWPLYYIDQSNPWSRLQGPDGQIAYVEDWGDASYGVDGFVVEDEEGTPFQVSEDGTLIAPYEGWTLDGVAVPVEEEGVLEGVDYAGALPAYADAEGNFAVVDEDGIPVGGVFTYEDATPVEWSEVGFAVEDDYTFVVNLSSKKSQWQVMTSLSSGITGVVHPQAYEEGKIEGGARTTYGTIDNPLVSYGVYKLIEWVDDGYFVFERNDSHYQAEDYRIKFVRYDVINDQSVAVNEFRQGRLDIAGVSGEYYETYKNSEFLKLSPATTFFRFAFSLDRMRDGDPSNDTPIMQYIEFRQALYYAVDRETFVTDVRSPGVATHSFLGPLYYSSEQSPFSYRASEAGQAVLDPYSPETYGYNPVLAKQLFDEAYAKAVADGHYEDGDTVEIEFVFADAETNHTMANWTEATMEAIFGDKFDLVKTPVEGTTLTATGTGIWDTGNFDLTFGGWQGLTFWAPGMLQVYSSVAGAGYMLEVGFDTGDAVLEVDLARGKVAVQAWLDDLNALAEPTEVQQGYIDDFEDFLAAFEGDIFTGTYDQLIFEIYYGTLDYDVYDGRDVDFDNITAALETELMDQMIAIPLFTVVSSTMYSERVVFEANAYHARMGWGGLKYMFIKE
jgi:oligopeptide transport system substrate-binding protein